MLVCDRCGMLMQEELLKSHREIHGHTMLGQALAEEIVDLECRCGGTFKEATKCEVCGEWFDNEGFHGVCEECFDEYETVGVALEIGAENTVSVEDINGFIAECLSSEMINKILGKFVEEHFVDRCKQVIRYCEEDKEYFSDFIREKVDK